MKEADQNRFSRYAGSKLHFVDRLNDIASSLDKEIYVEPFFGSGAIFFNLDKEYDSYVINDANVHVMNAVASFRDGDFDTYKFLRDKVFVDFGDIRNSKESYYNFRNWFNKEYFGKNHDRIMEGFMFHFLMNSCINSLVRIGPNGFNQSYGNRFMFIERNKFQEIQRRLKMNVTILSEDYVKVIEKYDSEQTLFFLDPPYFIRPTVGYQSTQSTEEDIIRFIDNINKLSGHVIYTDIPCDIHDKLMPEWHRSNTKMLDNISPLRRETGGNQEVFFSNFASKEKGTTPLF